MLPQTLAFVDIETTGLSVTSDRVIEVGILRVENNCVTKTFQTLINPQSYVSPSILTMTGISADELENAPIFSDIRDQILELMDDAVFVAHNVRFDYGFIRNEFLRLGEPFTSKHFCTVKLSKYLFPTLTRHNLDAIIERFHLTCSNRHRAFDDAKVLYEFYQVVQKQFSTEGLAKAVNLAMKKPSLPSNIDPAILQNLPGLPGVYIFYGQNGTPLYVGKSINIRDRVLSHFSNDHSSSREMKISQQIESIETIITAGELGALLKESFLVKKLQPIYNRQLRIARNIILVKKVTNKKGYHEVALQTTDTINSSDSEDILGVFRSERQAKTFLISLVKQYSLCEKFLTLQKTKTSCFSYQLGYCHGACVEKEIPLRYNMRFIEAFSKNKIKAWPFRGPIVITEKNNRDSFEKFLIDKWCILNTSTTGEFEGDFSANEKYLLDVDTYKILVQYLRYPKNHKNIRVFPGMDFISSSSLPLYSQDSEW